ncbi:MAG: RHS repeat domain-containing protein, partial [Armatimonadota bacterium]
GSPIPYPVPDKRLMHQSQFYVKADGSVVAYDWDGNGNMISRTEGNQTTQFDYDYDNRLVKITYPDGSVVRFGYDGLGRRVFRQEGNNVRYFYYDGDKIIVEREGSDWVVRYLLGLRSCGHVVNGQLRVYYADRLDGKKPQRPSDIVRKVEIPPAAVEPYKGRMKDHPIIFLPLPMDAFLKEAKYAAENFVRKVVKKRGVFCILNESRCCFRAISASVWGNGTKSLMSASVHAGDSLVN